VTGVQTCALPILAVVYSTRAPVSVIGTINTILKFKIFY